MPRFFPMNIPLMSVDIITSLLMALFSFFIYIKTKELEDLTSHKGIKFFRYAFLFFGISSLLKLFHPAIRLFGFHPGPLIASVNHFLVGIFVTLALLSILLSLIWKKIPESKWHHLTLPSIFAVLLASISLLFGRRHFPIIMIIHLLLFLFVAVLSVVHLWGSKKRAKHIQLTVVYPILFLSWTIDTIARFTDRINTELSMTLNVLATLLFILLVYKVLKKTK